jgi:hypothetical protein
VTNAARIEEAVDEATAAVTAVLSDPVEDDDSAVRIAWAAVARARDAIGELQMTLERSRAVREQAHALQDESRRLRRAAAVPDRPAVDTRRRKTDTP